MELDLLDKKIRRLVCKLKKYNIDLEVFDHEDIIYGSVLGKGGEGIVQKCTVWYEGLPVEGAVKTLLNNNDDAISITLDEIEMLCLAKHHIINTTLHVYGVAAVPDPKDPEMGYLVIITEAGIMNALQLYQKEMIPLHVTLDLWSRVAAAVQTLHNKKIIHQDIKPENILVTAIVRDFMGQIEKIEFKIIDLGMGKRVFTEKVVTEEIVGTNGYHPPEILFEEDYDFRADIFMLGVTFAVTLLPQNFLKEKLQLLLKKLHLSKQKKSCGRLLYESVLQPVIDNNNLDVPRPIKTMLCNMLQNQNKRTISLIDVVKTCYKQSEECRVQEQSLPPTLSPCSSGQDSGFGSENEKLSSRQSTPSTSRSTVRRRKGSDSTSGGRRSKLVAARLLGAKRKCASTSSLERQLRPQKRNRPSYTEFYH